MCGIVGTFNARHDKRRRIKRALEVIEHRGPDDSGHYEDEMVQLSMCRLAIIDLESGQQPIVDSKAGIALVFNGEIYNFQELRESLVSKGYNFVSQGDSEVILNLYREYGNEFPQYLNGMFAIAIWDKTKNTLVLCRDRLGKKPLWYSKTDESLIFASEIKSIFEFGVDKKIDFNSLSDCLVYGFSKIPNSPFLNIKQLAPGTIATFCEGKTVFKQYWNVREISKSEYEKHSAQERLHELLQSSVGLRLISEREVGVFLSGGVDSSLIALYAANLSSSRIKTFTVGFDTPEFDESREAENFAKRIGAEHHLIRVKPQPESVMLQLARTLDQPFGDSSVIPTYLLCKEARNHVVVALGGDGGDEVFGGYDRYRALLNTRWIKRRLTFLPLLMTTFPFLNEKSSRAIEMLRYSSLIGRYDSLLSYLSRSTFDSSVINKSFSYPISQQRSLISDSDDLLRELQKEDLLNYLPNDLMYKADMASMSVGLELRSPFLDYRMVEFGLSLPRNLKSSGGIGKTLLRESLEHRLPGSKWQQRKKGFAIPKADWIRGPLKQMAAELLFSEKTYSRGWVNCDYLKIQFEEHQKGSNRERTIWTPMMLELWARTWIDETTDPSTCLHDS